MPLTIPNFADNPLKLTNAQIDKVDVDALVAGFAQTGVISGCAVSAGSGMTVAVAAGSVVVNGTTVAVSAGNVTLAAAGATDYRFDLIVVNSAGVKSAVTGTPSAVIDTPSTAPVYPPIPANSVVLAGVWVPASDSVITADQITDKRVIVGAYLAATPVGDVTVTGKLLFAPGDTNLYRAGANQLATDDAFLMRNDFLYPGANMAGIYPKLYSDNSMGAAIAWNFSSGDGEVNFWNTYSSHGAGVSSFNFRQMNGASTSTLLASILGNGSLVLPRLNFPGTGAGGDILFGGSNSNFNVNLYKKSDDNLATDDTFWAYQHVVVGGKIYFNTNLVPLISSAGTDFTFSHQVWAPSFVSSGTVYVDYTNVGGRLWFGSDGTSQIWRTAGQSWLNMSSNLYLGASLIAAANVHVRNDAGSVYFGVNDDARIYRSGGNVLSTPGTFVANGYIQGVTMVYGNAGVSVHDGTSWIAMTGYAGGVRSSGHFYTAAGYSFVSSTHVYMRRDDSQISFGASDESYIAKYPGEKHLKIPTRLYTGCDGSSGGMWVDGGSTLFMGFQSSSRIGLYAGGWNLTLGTDAIIRGTQGASGQGVALCMNNGSWLSFTWDGTYLRFNIDGIASAKAI